MTLRLRWVKHVVWIKGTRSVRGNFLESGCLEVREKYVMSALRQIFLEIVSEDGFNLQILFPENFEF
jgi:hypothetical protein